MESPFDSVGKLMVRWLKDSYESFIADTASVGEWKSVCHFEKHALQDIIDISIRAGRQISDWDWAVAVCIIRSAPCFLWSLPHGGLLLWKQYTHSHFKTVVKKLKHFHIHFLSHDSCSLLIITFQSSANVLYFWIQSQCRIEMLNDLSMKKFFSVFFSFFFLPLWHTTWSLIWSEIPCFFNLEAELQEKQVTAGRRLETDYRWIWLFSVAPIIHVARGQGGLREPRHATQKDMQFTASTSQ